MPHARTSDGIALYYETVGDGPPVVFVHELAGSCRSFDPQVAALTPHFRCVTYNARGYPPSEVPPALDAYSQDRAAADIGAVLDALGLAAAHLVGVSMGAAAILHFALGQPARVRSLTLCSIGSGSDLPPGAFQANMAATAQLAETQGLAALAAHFGEMPNRWRLKAKNPEAFETFNRQIAGYSLPGVTNTMRGVQMRRPPLYAHRERIAALRLPVLVVVGSEDEPCRKPSTFLDAVLPNARLEIIDGTGHALNLEEPALVNNLLMQFIAGVERDRGGA